MSDVDRILIAMAFFLLVLVILELETLTLDLDKRVGLIEEWINEGEEDGMDS